MTVNDEIKVPVNDVSAYFNALAARDMFDEVVVIGRFKSDANPEEKEDGYDYYVATSTSTSATKAMISDATAEWLL